jgi:hypothetical protein
MSSTMGWRLEQGRGILQAAHDRVAVALDRIDRGLSDVDVTASTGEVARLLGIRIPGFPDRLPAAWLVDHYVRCDDLIATYERPHPDHLRVQVYWRYLRDEPYHAAVPADAVEGVHLIVSLQTDRLDRQPSLSVVSQLLADEVRCLDVSTDAAFTTVPELRSGLSNSQASTSDRSVDECDRSVHLGKLTSAPVWIIRRDDDPRSTVLMTLPADLVRATWRRAGALWQHEFHLLDEHLEKGVIRRAQVVAWWVPRAMDEPWARKWFDQWLTAAPPLTT